jgi:NTE family protein
LKGITSYGIVLGGGGAKGAYEIGVWKALRELRIPIDAVVGTSVGALNGAIMVQGDYELALELWNDLNMSKIIDFAKNLEMKNSKKSSLTSIVRTIKRSILDGGMDVTPLKELLKKVIDEDKIRKSDIDFGIVTFSLSDFKPIRLFKKDIPKGMLIEYLLASSCFLTFKPHVIDNKRYIDGGVYDNIPISLILEKCDNIIAVDVSGPGRIRKTDTSTHEIINIKNSEYLGGTLQFDGEVSKVNIDYGYYDTLRAFDKVKGKRYYFNNIKSRSSAYRNNIDDEEFILLYKFYNVELDGPKLGNLELMKNKFIKLIRQYSCYELSKECIFMGMLEICAEALEINRRRIYSVEELVNEILKEYYNYIEEKTNEKGILSKVHNHNLNRSIVFSNVSLNENSQDIIKKRITIGITLPKLAIANMFLSLILYRK